MSIINLHAYDDAVWLAERLLVDAGANVVVLRDYGGPPTKELKQKILIALYDAVLHDRLKTIQALARLLEARYETPRDTIPQLLVALQAEELEAA